MAVRAHGGRRPAKEFRFPGAFPLASENLLLNNDGVDLLHFMPPGSSGCGDSNLPVFDSVGLLVKLGKEHDGRVPTEACEPKDLGDNVLGT